MAFILTGSRVNLRRWKSSDREPFADLNADPEVMRYFPDTLTRSESDAFVDRVERGLEANGFGLWALEVEGQFAGYTGLNKTTFETPMGDHIEIGWRLARWAWGHGYATEAASLVLDFGFRALALSEIFSFTTESNARSEAVMKRIGMMRRADLDFDHPNVLDWWGARHIVYRATPSS